MSREFGDDIGGYFHNKMQSATDDLRHEAREDFHKEFIPLFEELYELAYAISSVEAGDSCIDRSILQSMESVPKMIKELEKINEKLYPYRRIAEEAIRQSLDKK